MDGQQVLEIATSSWAVLMAVSPLMQIRKMRQTGTSEDVSVGYFVVLTIGFLLWIAYGISIDSWVLYGPNTVSAIVATATIVVALRLRDRSGVTESGA